MAIIVALGVIWFFMVSFGKATKAKNILHTLGYKDIAKVTVYAKHEFLREDINVKGYKYTVSFVDLSTNEKCKGFVLKDFKGNVTKDLTCQKQ
jgi:hypothetical protein